MATLVKKKNRRSMKRNKVSNQVNKIRIMGVNSAGIRSKLPSLNNVLKNLNPSIFFIEETKLKKQGKLNIEKSFVIYELNRKEKNGGGIAIGVKEELKPMWISEGNDDLEILVVEVDISNIRVRCVGGYGPQENDVIQKKKAFWDRLSNEVDDATENEAGFLLQMDGNLWVGQEVVKDEPNSCI